MTRKTFLTFSIKLILTTVIVYFVAEQVVKHWSDVQEYHWQVDILHLFFSIALSLIAFFIFSLCWRLIIHGFGYQLEYKDAFRISYLSNLGRYIPGKVWQMFGMLYMAGKKGIPKESAVASFVIIQLFAIPASLLVFVVCLQLRPELIIDRIAILGDRSALMMTSVMLILSIFVILYPNFFLSLINKLLAILKRDPISFRLDKKVALTVFTGYLFGWICFGLAFWFFITSIIGHRGPDPVSAIGLFNGAYQIGYLALFAPGGFGPRELVMSEMLVPYVASLAAMTAILARLWAILIETIAAVISILLKK